MPSISFIAKVALAAGALVQPAFALPSSTARPTSATAKTTFSPSSSRPPATSTVKPASTFVSKNTYSRETACADIALAQTALYLLDEDTELEDFSLLPLDLDAVDACLRSVPIDKTAATAFIDWYKPYLQFQSTLGWLKNPPASYQQPAVDLVAGLDAISSQVTNNKFGGEYEFELAIQNLLHQSHDGHLSLSLPMFGAFRFTSPYYFVSLSADGSKVPDIFVLDDVTQTSNSTTKLPWTPSPITLVNGQKALDFFTTFGQNFSDGQIDPNGDWNNMFVNQARINGLGLSTFGQVTVIPDNFNMSLSFGNGTSVTSEWVAFATKKLNLLGVETPQDFYDAVVAADDEDEEVEDQAAPPPATDKKPQVTTWGKPYPAPVVAQQNLTVGGFFTGYFLNKSSIAVMSLPSFYFTSDESLKGFQSSVADFLVKCKAAGMKKLIIDLQGNGGGKVVAGFDFFKQIFPTLEPFGGSQIRASKGADVIGSTLIKGNATQQEDVAGGLFTPATSLDINNKAYSSWPAMFGPVSQGGDQVSNIIRIDLSNGTRIGGKDFSVSGYGARKTLPAPVFAPQDILILTDAYCGSTCSIFAEEMHTQAGVKVVVAGGRPETGPMQGVSGVRGSQLTSGDEINSYTNIVTQINKVGDKALPNTNLTIPINVPTPLEESLRLNGRNQIRKSKQDVPLQFVYQAANCRIWYTAASFANYEVLWQTAADALWTNNGLCVAGSTNHPSSAQNTTTTTAVPKNGNGTTTLNKPLVITGAAEGINARLSTALFMGVAAAAMAALL